MNAAIHHHGNGFIIVEEVAEYIPPEAEVLMSARSGKEQMRANLAPAPRYFALQRTAEVP